MIEVELKEKDQEKRIPNNMEKVWKIAGICFEHMHMGDLLKNVYQHPTAEIVGISHTEPSEMKWSVDKFSLDSNSVYTDYVQCLENNKPDIVILCPKVADHLTWVKKIAEYDVHVIMEKPFAVGLNEAQEMVSIMKERGKQLIINWPMAWYPTNVTCNKLIQQNKIGEVREVHYYDGNRGPLYHGSQKEKRKPTLEEKKFSWWYSKKDGGGSLLDYLGYGVTLGSWFNQGKRPLEVFSQKSGHPDLEVDEHSITILKYKDGLSKFETKWGTHTDPWTYQPSPKCGFMVTGTMGSISCFDFEDHVTLYSKENQRGEKIPVVELIFPNSNPVEYLIHCLEKNLKVEGPLSVELSLLGQEIVDAAFESSETGKLIKL